VREVTDRPIAHGFESNMAEAKWIRGTCPWPIVRVPLLSKRDETVPDRAISRRLPLSYVDRLRGSVRTVLFENMQEGRFKITIPGQEVFEKLNAKKFDRPLE
jgi:hypothetical protein